NAVGLLKEELKLLGSLIMEAALIAEVPAGGALAVDREVFSSYIDEKLRSHPAIEIMEEEATSIPGVSATNPVIIATGPLTSKPLAGAIEALIGTNSLAFFDAISPIITYDSLDLTKIFRQSRYDKGGGSDYLNIPLNEAEYCAFVEAVRSGEKYGGQEQVEADRVDDLRPFEGCMPIEEMVERGPDTLRFGPMKPVGLTDPRTGRRPYAVIQLRQDDKAGTLWSMVGFQTRLKQPEQKRIFCTLPGLENAEFVRLGSVHRNTFINSPSCLEPTAAFRGRPGLYFAGQITGVEGYVESTACGLVAGLNAQRLMAGNAPLIFPGTSAIGALMAYISDPSRVSFQPMNISYGLLQGYCEGASSGTKKVSRKDKRIALANKSLTQLTNFI
ncbi:MAG: methylenetetrahydrofolate--tRNA-(uracil(54)-C(5))-methyltransferase (FADH(2)-oxidizing) TrmFO, partial [Proteobacteria bacterium]